MLFVHDVLSFNIPSARQLFSGQVTKVTETGIDGLYSALVTDQAGQKYAFVLDSKQGAVMIVNGKQRTIVGSFEKRMHC